MNIKKLNETLKAKIKETIFDDEEQEQVLDYLKTVDYDTLKQYFLANVKEAEDYANLFQQFEYEAPESATTWVEEFYIDNFDSIDEIKIALNGFKNRFNGLTDD